MTIETKSGSFNSEADVRTSWRVSLLGAGADISTEVGVSLFLSSRGVTGAGYSTSERLAAESLPRSRATS